MYKTFLSLFFLGFLALESFANAGTPITPQEALKCRIRYHARIGENGIEFIEPQNSNFSVVLKTNQFCDETGCESKLDGTAAIDTGIVKASARVVGDRAFIFMNDLAGNKTAASINSEGLRSGSFGDPSFSMDIQGQYQGKNLVGISMSCSLQK